MSLNYGLDSNSGKVSDEFVKGIKDFNYKALVLNNYNGAKATILATAQHNFSKEMVAGCFLAVDTLANMIIPYIPTLEQTNRLRTDLHKTLDELDNDYDKIYSMDRFDRTNYVKKCEKVIVLLTPNLSRVGIGATVKAVGTFSYDQIISNKMKAYKERKKEGKL